MAAADGHGPPDAAGAEVLAVANATVVRVRDGIAEPAAGAPRPAVPIADATGNYVALDLGPNRYAFYEHLAPGLRVRAGDRVSRGQILGRVGSTGQAMKAHLHFHVADAPEPLSAEGLPYRLTRTTVIGRYSTLEQADAGGEWTAAHVRPLDGLPEPNSVVMMAAPVARR